ncbi:MAG: hypothetical protein HY608_11825, partial [Planctomycetes bacterium]|nr:hypothetical protein [Planctomycetota bacterium]
VLAQTEIENRVPALQGQISALSARMESLVEMRKQDAERLDSVARQEVETLVARVGSLGTQTREEVSRVAEALRLEIQGVSARADDLDGKIRDATARLASSSHAEVEETRERLLAEFTRALSGKELREQIRTLAEEVARARRVATPEDLDKVRAELQSVSARAAEIDGKVREASARVAAASHAEVEAAQERLLAEFTRALSGKELREQIRGLAEEVVRSRRVATPEDVEQVRAEASRARLEVAETVPGAVRRELTSPEGRRLIAEAAKAAGVDEARLDGSLDDFLVSDRLAGRIRTLASSASADAVAQALQGRMAEQMEASLRKILPTEMKDLHSTMTRLVEEAVRQETERPKFRERLLDSVRGASVTEPKMQDALRGMLQSEALFERITAISTATADRLAADARLEIERRVEEVESRLLAHLDAIRAGARSSEPSRGAAAPRPESTTSSIARRFEERRRGK